MFIGLLVIAFEDSNHNLGRLVILVILTDATLLELQARLMVLLSRNLVELLGVRLEHLTARSIPYW